MDKFAFIIHPIDPKRDVSRKFPLLGRALNEKQINFFSTYFPPVSPRGRPGPQAPRTSARRLAARVGEPRQRGAGLTVAEAAITRREIERKDHFETAALEQSGQMI